MKIFEYSWKSGRGEVLDNCRFSGVGGQIGTSKSGVPIHSDLCIIVDVEDEDDERNIKFVDLAVEDYGVEAITFCIGVRDDKWSWFIVPCTEMVKKAMGRNLRLYGTSFNTRK